MQPHPGVNVPVGFTGIQEVPGELFSKLYIGAAATPLPGVLWSREVSRVVLHDAMYHTLSAVDGLQLQTVEFDSEGFFVPAPLLVTTASLQFAHRARIGYCVHYTSRCNCISKSAFSETSFEDYAVVRYFIPGLQAGAVPPVSSELVLALVDGNLDSLDCGGCNVWITHTHLQLAPRQSWQRQTDCVGVQDGINIGKLQAQDFIGVYPFIQEDDNNQHTSYSKN